MKHAEIPTIFCGFLDQPGFSTRVEGQRVASTLKRRNSGSTHRSLSRNGSCKKERGAPCASNCPLRLLSMLQSEHQPPCTLRVRRSAVPVGLRRSSSVPQTPSIPHGRLRSITHAPKNRLAQLRKLILAVSRSTPPERSNDCLAQIP